MNVYPMFGTAEIGFGSLRRRPPFDDVALREELRHRIEKIDGVGLPAGKIALYPSFSLDLLRDETSADQLVEALGWFVTTVHEFDVRDTAEAPGG